MYDMYVQGIILLSCTTPQLNAHNNYIIMVSWIMPPCDLH